MRETLPKNLFVATLTAVLFNKDGNVDVAVADFVFGSLLTMPGVSTVLFGDGHGNFPSSLVLTTGSQTNAAAVTDVDGDGWPDVVLMNGGSFDVSVFLNDRTGTFQAPYTFAVGVSPSAFVVADVDGDGRPDLISVSSSGIEITLNRSKQTSGANVHGLRSAGHRQTIAP